MYGGSNPPLPKLFQKKRLLNEVVFFDLNFVRGIGFEPLFVVRNERAKAGTVLPVAHLPQKAKRGVLSMASEVI